MEFVEIALDPIQKKAWEQTRSALLWQAPGFTHIFQTMMNPKSDDNMLFWTKDLPTMATDGNCIMANPEFFFGLPLWKRVFAIAHEISHGIFDHCGVGAKLAALGNVNVAPGKDLPYDPAQANVYMDYVINDVLVQSKIGEIDPKWLHDPKIATQNDNWVDVYAKHYKKNKQPPGGGFDQHLAPGKAPGGKPNQQRSPQTWKNAIAAAAQITKEQTSRGDGSAAMTKFFEQFLDPYVSWTDQIFGVFARKVGSGGYDYRRADRRLLARDIFAPSRSGNGAGTVVIVGDSSGSIFMVKSLQDRFFAEMSGLLADLKPRRIILIWCDAEIKEVIEVADEIDLVQARYKGMVGGGGTSFVPPFEYLEKEGVEDIDALVYLTDGDGDFPTQQPDYPVIWGNIKRGQKSYPWGDVIEIPSDGTA